MTEMLGYGAIGLSWALAGLAYNLLSKEQQQVKPRKNMISSIYIFMFMAFMLSLIGFAFELSKEEGKNKSISSDQKVVEIKKIISRLTSAKTNLIENLEKIKLSNEQDQYTIRAVISSIKEIDNAIKEEVK
jgi:hypothetical protein